MEISLPYLLAFWVISLVLIQSALQKLECSDEIEDHIQMPLDVAYLTVSNIPRGTHKRNKRDGSVMDQGASWNNVKIFFS